MVLKYNKFTNFSFSNYNVEISPVYPISPVICKETVCVKRDDFMFNKHAYIFIGTTITKHKTHTRVTTDLTNVLELHAMYIQKILYTYSLNILRAIFCKHFSIKYSILWITK